MQPLVSVIMASYRHALLLPEAVESVLTQGVELELIIVDDASPDNSKSVIEALAREHPEISVLFNEKNLGIAKTHNRGVDRARGEYIAFLPSDDYWYPGKLKAQIRTLEGDHRLLGTFADADVVTLEGKRTGGRWSTLHPAPPCVDESNLASRLLHGMFVSGNTGIYRRAEAGGLKFDESLALYNDWLFWIMLALRGPLRAESESRAAYRTSAATFARPPLVLANDQIRLLEILAPFESRFEPEDFDRLVMGAILGLTMKGSTVKAFQQMLRSRPAVRSALSRSRFPLRWMVSWMRFHDQTVLSSWNQHAAYP